MNRLILVKHSLPEMVPETPAREWTLSKAGRERCQELVEKVTPYLPDLIVSSLEPKAIETAEILARHLARPFRTFEGLHEHDRADVGYLEREQFESRVADFFRHPEDLVLGKETARQARERFSRALASVEIEYPNKSILVVSHGTVITLFVTEQAGLEPFPFWQKLDLPSFVVFSLPEHKLLTTVESVLGNKS